MSPLDGYRRCLLAPIGRVICYSTALFFVMWASDRWFQDTYIANLCLFTLFAVVFELLYGHFQQGLRLWCYLACILCLAICGTILMSEAMKTLPTKPPSIQKGDSP